MGCVGTGMVLGVRMVVGTGQEGASMVMSIGMGKQQGGYGYWDGWVPGEVGTGMVVGTIIHGCLDCGGCQDGCARMLLGTRTMAATGRVVGTKMYPPVSWYLHHSRWLPIWHLNQWTRTGGHWGGAVGTRITSLGGASGNARAASVTEMGHPSLYPPPVPTSFPSQLPESLYSMTPSQHSHLVPGWTHQAPWHHPVGHGKKSSSTAPATL